jgi:hypothetical protein
MQSIKNYTKKIDAAIASKSKKASVPKGLVSPFKKEEGKSEDKDFLLIMNTVKGIRNAREKMLNGK